MTSQRGRLFDPDVLMRINEAIDAGAGAPAIQRWLERKLEPGTPIPSVRSIGYYRLERLGLTPRKYRKRAKT